MHFLIYSITFVAYKPKERSCISMARPIKETPILFGEDARRFEERWKESVVKRRSSGKKGWKTMNWQWKSLKNKIRTFSLSGSFVSCKYVLENKTGCRFLTVDAYAAAVPFYEKNGFIPLNRRCGFCYTFALFWLEWYCALD